MALPRIGAHFTPPFISLTRREYEVDYVVLELLDMGTRVPGGLQRWLWTSLAKFPSYLSDMAESVSTSVSTSVGPSWPISRVLQCLPLHSAQRLLNGTGIVTSE